ncbi:NAD(P)-dependent dehydrogenase (short-subunit alcohol dehydrogenase family) [Rhodoferax ferrireducens]|uniref:NAD(P)-dependent dehydrogenase (Short-subunit alcohol dehydrogenase family) n=1 Tax=Rhodoferax ferrireducens TaxID=192843 RepID=A0ABU2CBF5_9BURK|nr:SDR family NAD(P)-dependent oxidoreductase [Rhodoferax ferrireducens]MDR7378658.1 NAD(P)-dependent dehydrogenase (short-subunit alcohol dehydrogenase family) [Rhodoferax ferrireducens]
MALNPPITDWRGKTVWLIGASSGIGRATAQLLHGQGAQVVVSARHADALQRFVAEHPGAHALPLDAADPAALRAAADGLEQLDAVIYCAGYYRPQRATAYSLAEMQQHLQVNYVGALHLLDAVLPRLLRQGHGHISLVASVAGYSGLPQSLAYGPTKAALINLAETLYLDLHDRGIGVSLVCPGFVQTPLTAHNDFPMPALITPEAAAFAILRGWRRGQFEIHFPKRFTLWMKALALLPYRAYFPAIRRMTGL